MSPLHSYIGPVNCSDVTLEDTVVVVNRGTGCNIVSAGDLISFLELSIEFQLNFHFYLAMVH